MAGEDRPVFGPGNTTARNHSLPFPVVKYSSAFIAFKEMDHRELCFCECARDALKNFIECQRKSLEDSHQDVTPENVLQHSTPDEAVTRVLDAGVTDPSEIVNALRFEPELCHKCNDVVPKLRHSADMYGSTFEQNYGWYVKQRSYEWGICNPASDTALTDTCIDELPDDVAELIDEDVIEDLPAKAQRLDDLTEKRRRREREINDEQTEAIREVREELSDDLSFREQLERTEPVRQKYEDMDALSEDEQAELDALKAELEENSKRVKDAVENAVRRDVGHYEKGDRWTSETILYQLIESEYGDEFTIERHHRPAWLDGLELDIYIKEADVGIEYQGVQHYESVEHWGGEEALEERQARDERTRELCEEHGVELVEVRHDEDLSEELVQRKIAPVINDE